MDKTKKLIIQNLKDCLNGFKSAKKDYGYDLANETFYVKEALRLLKQTDITDYPVNSYHNDGCIKCNLYQHFLKVHQLPF